MHDTSPEMQQRWAAMFARRTPEERLEMASSMYETGRQLMVAAINREFPEITEAELRGKVFKRLYAGEFSKYEMIKIASRIPNVKLDLA